MHAILSFPVRLGQGAMRLYRYAVIDSVRIVKDGGFRELFRQRGWRFVGALVAYYVVRDTLLYLVLPLMVAKGLF
jgi:hypothetical protein